jgi:hypothetical protein
MGSFMLDPTQAAAAAEQYFSVANPLTKLGWGISGHVFLSPDLGSVVKVHHFKEGFERELDVYRRLQRLRITRLHGLSVPKLIGHRAELNLIQMDFVSAPYLLDFAGVLFRPPDFPEDTMQRWHEGIQEMFGPNAHVAYAVYNSLAKHGMYYVDFRPSNLNTAGLPGLEPFEPGEEESW